MTTKEGLELLIRFYQDEELRRRDIDQKASWGFGFSGIAASLIASGLGRPLMTSSTPFYVWQAIYVTIYAVGLLSIMLALIFFLKTLGFRSFREPLGEEKSFRDNLGGDKVSYDELFSSFMTSLLENRVLNDEKADKAQYGFSTLFLGICLELTYIFISLVLGVY